MAEALNLVSNLAIVLGYFLVPVLWLPYLPLPRWVFVGGVAFFVTCGLTHLWMAFNHPHSDLMVLNHIVQAVAVHVFIVGFFIVLRRADRKKKELEQRLRESGALSLLGKGPADA